MRAITLDLLRKTIKSYGCNRLAKEINCPRQVLQRVASGRRKPSPQLLAKLGLEEITLYRATCADEPTKGDDQDEKEIR